jgi:general secretion pathway protein K
VRKGKITDLTEPWAVPLAEARLSTFLAADKDNNTDDGGVEAFLSGSISDAQGRYNLNNLIGEKGPDANEVAVLAVLCTNLGIDIGVADRIAKGLFEAKAGTTANAPLLPKMVSQLTWLGVDPASVAALEPYVVLLPTDTAVLVNINTAPREVLSAVIKGNDVATSERILQVRQRTPFKSLDDFKKQFPSLDMTNAKLAVGSDWFEVRGRLRLADRILEERSLIQRLPAAPFSKIWERQRVSSRESTGS